MGIKSAYRALKERVKKPSVVKEMFVLDTLQEQLNSDWKTVEKENLQSDPDLVSQRDKAQAFLTAGNFKDAGPAIQELQALIPTVRSSRISEAQHDAQVLKQTAERPPPNLKPEKPKKQLARMRLGGEKITEGKASGFIKQFTVGGEKYGKPEYLASGSFGDVAKYTSDTGQTVAVKKVPFNTEFEKELQVNQVLLNGNEDARGRDNVMLMKAYAEAPDGTSAYIVMDCAAGDLNDTKHAMNALSESGALPEEARSILNQHMMKQALEGMMYLRDQNVTHYDLKELNAFIMPDGTVKVADFGMSQVGVEGGSQVGYGGTPVYNAPEVENSKYGKFTAADDPTKSDTHSLGRMLDSLHTGDSRPHVGQGIKSWGANPELTGALSRVNEAMTRDAAQQRPTLEAALDASYFRNLDNYDPQAVKDLIAATVSYSSAMRGKKVDGQGYKELSDGLHKKRQELAKLEKSMKPGQEVIESLGQEIMALEEEIRAIEHAEIMAPGNYIAKLKQVLQEKQQEVQAERAKEQQISTQDQSLGNQIRALQATLKPIREEVQALQTELQALETSEPRDEKAIDAKKQELRDKQSVLQEKRQPLDALLKPWNDKRQEIQKTESDLQKLNEDPAVKPHLDKVRQLSAALQRPPEEVTAASQKEFTDQLKKCSVSAEDFHSFVGLNQFAKLWEASGIKQADVKRLAELHRTTKFKENESQDEIEDTKLLDKIHRDVAAFVQSVAQPEYKEAVDAGLKKVLEQLSLQYENAHQEPYTPPK